VRVSCFANRREEKIRVALSIVRTVDPFIGELGLALALNF